MAAAVWTPAAGRPVLLGTGLLLSVLVHLALVLWLLDGRTRAVPAAQPTPRPLEVRWIPATPPASSTAAAEPAAIPGAPPRRAARRAPRAAAAPLPPQTSGTRLTETPAVASPPGEAPAAAPPAPAEPLDLSVPRNAGTSLTPSQQATADPRANVHRSPAEAIARRLTGTPERTEQRMAHGGWVVRQGTRCWELRPARANDLHPFDVTSRPIPHGVRRCDDD